MKLSNIIPIVLFVPAAISLVVASSKSSVFSGDPKAPDQISGHTIPVPIASRGIGSFYMTKTEWDSVSIYWHVFYGFAGLLFLFIALRFVHHAYQNFMQEWRKH